MQRCGQCGFELTDAAIKMGYCPNCGSLLRVDGAPPPATEGQLVPPPVLSVAAVRGLPPEPGAPAASEPSVAPTPGAPGGLPQPNLVTAPPQVIIQRSSGAVAAIAIAALVVVLAAGGVLYAFGTNGQGPLAAFVRGTSSTVAAPGAGATTVAATATAIPQPTATTVPTATPVPPTPTPLPTVPPAPLNFKLFTAADGSFGLNVPANWGQKPVVATGVTGVNFDSSLTSQDFVQIDQGSTSTFEPARIEDYVRNFASSSAGTGTTITQSAAPTTLGRNTWTGATATYLANGAQHKVIGLAVTHGQSTYLFFYDALANAFSTEPGTSYDTMVKSFTFLT